MRRRDALRLLLLSPLTLRPARSAHSAAQADAVTCYREAIETLAAWTEPERAMLDAAATPRLDLAAARLVRRGRAALDALGLGAKVEACDWSDHWTGARFCEVTWVFAGRVARLALLRARFAFEAGWERRGLADVSDVLAMSGHFVRGRVFMPQLIGFAGEHAAIEAVAASLPRLSIAGLGALSDRLDRLHPLLPLEDAIRGERDFFNGYVRPNDPDSYDQERSDRLLAFYDRLMDAVREDRDDAFSRLRDDLDGDGDERSQFLDSFEGHRRARLYLGVRRAMIRAAIAVAREGSGAIESVPDPTDGRAFGLSSWASGFELTSRFALPDRPPASLLVGSR